MLVEELNIKPLLNLKNRLEWLPAFIRDIPVHSAEVPYFESVILAGNTASAASITAQDFTNYASQLFQLIISLIY